MLTKEQIRDEWERDKREGFEWLAKELTEAGQPTKREALAKTAKRKGWMKRDKSTQEVVTVVESVPPVTKVKKDPMSFKRLAGRPSIYSEDHDEFAKNLALLGATDKEMLTFFKIDESTFYDWIKKHPSFSKAVREGKLEADAKVAGRLYNRAMGYDLETEKIFNNNGEVIRAETVTHYPADVGAIKMWLYNRRAKDWKDKQEVTHNHSVDPDMIEKLTTVLIERMQKARERQRTILIERGILVE